MKIVVGVDSGGSRTRALAVSLEGERVGYAETGGGNPGHDQESEENLRESIRRVTQGHEAVRLIAGVAGLDGPADEARLTAAMAGFDLPKTLVNDAVVAHAGALLGRPGIVSIQGTGSTIRAILEDGRHVRNSDFSHYAPGGAVRVGLAGLQMLLTTPASMRDVALWEAAYALWEVESPEALRAAAGRQRDLEPRERSRRHGEFARAITVSTEAGWLHSLAVCHAAGKEIVRGIRLLGPLFGSERIEVALVGGCVRSAAMRECVGRLLVKAQEKRYAIVEPALPPMVGAIWMALRDEGIELRGGALQSLVPFGS